MRSSRFDLRVSDPASSGTATIVTVTGEVDATNVSGFEHEVNEIARTGPTILDLTDLQYFDSTAFAALDRLLSQGRTSLVIAERSMLARAASLMTVPYHQDLDAAQRALQKPQR
jgi:anti-anti-sigma factor